MTAEEYWKQKYDEQDELFGHRWDAIVKFNVDTMESWGRLQIKKDRERVKKHAKVRNGNKYPGAREIWEVDPKSIDETPIT